MNELILKFKDEAIKNMIEKDVLASVQLVYLLANKDSKIEPEVLLNEITEREDLKGVKDYKEACRIFASSNKEKNKFIYLLESNKLYEYDNQALDQQDTTTGDSIEVNIKEESKPAVEVYSVKETFESETSLCNTNNLEQAKEKCKEGYSVFDSKGRTVYTTPIKVEEEKQIQPEDSHKKAIVAGAFFNLKFVKGYSNSVSINTSITLNGGYYISDGNIMNGRVKIVDNRSKCGTKDYLCYVNVDDLCLVRK